MARHNVRVIIPTDPSALIALAQLIEKKHVELGDASPLKDEEDAAVFSPAVVRGAENDAGADKSRKVAETLTGERNKDLPVIDDGVRRRRDTLLAKYRSNPKKLTEFGFEVDDSPQSSSEKTAPAK